MKKPDVPMPEIWVRYFERSKDGALCDKWKKIPALHLQAQKIIELKRRIAALENSNARRGLIG